MCHTVLHPPSLCSNGEHGPTAELIQWLEPVLTFYKVQVRAPLGCSREASWGCGDPVWRGAAGTRGACHVAAFCRGTCMPFPVSDLFSAANQPWPTLSFSLLL